MDVDSVPILDNDVDFLVHYIMRFYLVPPKRGRLISIMCFVISGRFI